MPAACWPSSATSACSELIVPLASSIVAARSLIVRFADVMASSFSFAWSSQNWENSAIIVSSAASSAETFAFKSPRS